MSRSTSQSHHSVLKWVLVGDILGNMFAVNEKCVDVSKKMIDDSQDTQKLSKLDITRTAMRTYYKYVSKSTSHSPHTALK